MNCDCHCEACCECSNSEYDTWCAYDCDCDECEPPCTVCGDKPLFCECADEGDHNGPAAENQLAFDLDQLANRGS